MNERKKLWTPGPWKVGKTGPNGCPPVGTEKGLMVSMGAHSINDPKQCDQAKANAQLISAAPDLVEALVKVISDSHMLGHVDPKTLNLAEQVLEKAYGDSGQ